MGYRVRQKSDPNRIKWWAVVSVTRTKTSLSSANGSASQRPAVAEPNFAERGNLNVQAASRNEVTEMGEVDELLAAVVSRQRQADLALLNTDAGPRKVLWSHKDPVTVFGAANMVSGWPEVESLFDWLASNFSNGDFYELDVTAASVIGDLGCVVGGEHLRASVGVETPAAIALRVTLIFRREGGEWKEVHRHADPILGIRSKHEQLGRFR